MLDQSPAIAAAVRAIGGESDLDAVLPALCNAGLAQVIACAHGAHPHVWPIAALCGHLPDLLDPDTFADPAFHDSIRRVIGTVAGYDALWRLAEVAPAGWGAAYAEALIAAVHANMVDASVAAALIGPNDTVAGLLRDAWDVAFAIRNWGQANAAPDAWADALTPAERDRLIAALLRDSFQVASCIPWLPPDAVNQTNIVEGVIGEALDAFAIASPTARAQHAAILQHLVARAQPRDLDALTRLACATQFREVWRRVQTLIRESPENAWRVVVAAPWNDLPDDVRDAILDRPDVCAAVVAARGERAAEFISFRDDANAFFAALKPAVWDALTPDAQREWRQSLEASNVVLAVRSLGLRPEVLAQATLTNDLVRAVQWHTRDAAATRATLLQVALRMVDPESAHALIAAMPLPSDPGAFFCIAGGCDDPDVLAPARSALRTPADLAFAVAIQRSGDASLSIRARSATLRSMLRGQTWDALTPFMPVFGGDVRAAFMPDLDDLIKHMAHPDRQDAFRQALVRLAALPPEVAVPTFIALTQWTPWNASETAAALAVTLRAHGDIVLALADALADDRQRAALLPLPDNPALVRPLRGLTHDDPATGIRLAHALQTQDRRTALLALLHAPPQHAVAVWQALDNAVRRGVVSVLAAAPSDADPLAVHDPIAALALAALQSSDDDLRDAGVTALAQRTETLRALWGALAPEVQQTLRAHLAVADLSPSMVHPSIQSRRRRGRA